MDAEGRAADPSAVREILYEVAGAYWTLRDAWREGDRFILDLLDKGWQSHTGSFERLAKDDGREPVRRARFELKRLLPGALLHVDPWLRARLLRLLSTTDPDSDQPDSDGEVGVRWRHHWVETGLETEVEEVLALLRVAGDVAARDGRRESNPEQSDAPPPPPLAKPLKRAEKHTILALLALSPSEALTGAELIAYLDEHGVHGVDQGKLTSRLIPGLRKGGWDIPNRRGGVGYYLTPEDRRRAEAVGLLAEQ
jgi:hypothetical protein